MKKIFYLILFVFLISCNQVFSQIGLLSGTNPICSNSGTVIIGSTTGHIGETHWYVDGDFYTLSQDLYITTDHSITVTNSDLGGTYYVTVAPPIGNSGLIEGEVEVCQGQTVIYNVPVISNATQYTWTFPGGGGVSNANSYTVNFGTNSTSGNITVTGTNACGMSNTSIFPVTVNPLPSNGDIITGDANICINQGAVIESYSVTPITNADSYIWTLPSGATGTSSINNITVNYGASAVSGNITVMGNNACGNGTPVILPISVSSSLPNNAANISGLDLVCQGQNSVTYTVPTITNATSYVWTLPSGVTGTSTTNSITVNYGTSAVSGDITVKGNNSCGDGAVSTKAITVNPLPVAAGTITGTATVCQGQGSITYSVPTITNATSYVWTLPSGATGTSTTNSIIVNYSTSATSGDITVKGHNSCGDGAISNLTITVNPLPESAGAISGNTSVFQSDNMITYTVPSILNATSYLWTLPNGVTGSSTTNSISVNFSSSATSGNISVKGLNSCGEGVPSSFAISVSPSCIITNYLPSKIVKSIAIDTEGNKWFGTTTGVAKFDGTNWTTYTTTNGLVNNIVNAIAIDAQGNKWFGTNGGVSKFNGTTWTTYTTTSGLANNIVYAIAIDLQGNKWFGTDAGISKFNGTTWSTPNSQKFYAITVDTEGIIWCGNQLGLYWYNGVSWSARNFNTVKAVSIDNQGNKWCGTSGGVVKFDGANLTTLNTTNGLINNSVNSTSIDNIDTKWFGTSDGISKYDGSNWVSYTTTNGLPSNIINAIMLDSINIKWICTNNGVSKMKIYPSNAQNINGTDSVCSGQSMINYSVPPIENATSYIWTLPSGATGSSTTNSISVNFGTSAVSGDITVKGNNTCGDGTVSTKAITVNSLPVAAGTITGSATVCQGQSSVTYTVPTITNATSYVWSLPAGATGTSTTNSITVNYGTSAVSGDITVKGNNTCGDGAASTKAIMVNPLPVAAGTITGNANVCQGQSSVTYTVPTITNATSYIWTLPAGATGTSTTNSITVNYGTSAVSGDITVKGSNTCGDGASSNLSITVTPLVEAAGAITGTTTVCQGQNSVTYTVPTIANATSYVWSLPAGASGSSTTNSITVNYGTSAVSGDITVKGNNTCGDGASSILTITVTPLVEAAGTITGTTTVCQGQNSVTYTVPAIANATSYIWSLPTGTTGTSTTNSITVDYGTSAISGNITVKGTNSCGDGASSNLTITVTPLVEAAGTITGATTVCQGQNSVTYTVPMITNATSYIWTLPAGATGTSTTNSITVNYGTSATSGNITVKGSNSCGDGAASTLAITVNNKPTAPVISQNGNILHSNAVSGNQWYDQNGFINGATNQNYTVTVNGDYHTIVTLLGCSSEASNTIHVTLTGVDFVNNDRNLKVYPNPVSNELIIEIEGNSEKVNFDVINAIGQVVYKGSIIEKATVQTSNFALGVYLIKLENGKTFEFKKIIKE